MRRETEVTSALDLTEEEEAAIRKIQENIKTRADAQQYDGILQLYNELQAAKGILAKNPDNQYIRGLLVDRSASLKQQIQDVQPRLAAMPNAPAASVSINPAPTYPLMDFLQRGATAVRDVAASFWSGLKNLYQQAVAPQAKPSSTNQQESATTPLLHSSDARVMTSLSTADPQEQQRLAQKIRVERAEKAVAEAYKGLASLPGNMAWKERIAREEQILKQERMKYLEMGGVLVEKIKLPDPAQSAAVQKPAASATTSVIHPTQRTDAVLFLAKVAILEQLSVDDPKRQKFIQDEKKKQEVLTGKNFEPEKEYTLEKFLEKHGAVNNALKSTKSDSVENIGIEAMSKACHLIGKNPKMTTELTHDTGIQYASRIKNNSSEMENNSVVTSTNTTPTARGISRG